VINKKIQRCQWCLSVDEYIKYYDNEWEVTAYDNNKIFECLVLETMQSGLSIATIFKKESVIINIS